MEKIKKCPNCSDKIYPNKKYCSNCMDIMLFGSKERAKQAAKDSFKKLGL